MKKIRNLRWYVVAIVLSPFFILPFYWVVISTTKDIGQLFEGTLLPGIPNHFNDNTIQIFSYSNAVFLKWLLNSLLYSTAGSLTGVFVAALAGFSFRRYNFWGKKILYIMILGFAMVPGYATLLPLFVIFKNFGLLDTRLTIIIPSIAYIFGVYLMIVYWNQIPQELFDAAEIDGAGDIFIFFKIGLPNILPGFITLVLLLFMFIWNNYFLALIMINSRDKMPLILGITTIYSHEGIPIYNLTLTGAFYTLLPLLFLFAFLQRFFKPQLGGITK